MDCRRDTTNIDLDQIEEAITAKTKTIIPVHIGGRPCDMDRILEMEHAWHLCVLQLNLERPRIWRNEFIKLLRQEHIGASVHFILLHLHPYYRETFGCRPEDFPSASAVFEYIISLPTHPKLAEANVQRVIDTVKRLVCQHRL